MNNELTTKQENRLRELTDKINNWIHDRFKVGEYLSEIRDSKLYQRDFDTFEEFCEKTFNIKKSQAYRLIEASEFKKLPEGKHVENERQARKSLNNIKSEPKTSPMGDKIINLDKTGFPIPDSIIDEWNRAEEVGREIMGLASNLKCSIEKGTSEDDPVFREITNSAITYAINIHGSVRNIKPYCVCTSCQGVNPGKCTLCRGRGFFSEFMFKTAIPEEIKEIRVKTLSRVKNAS